MTMKSGFIAVIAVAIIAIVGVGVYFAFFNGGSDEKLAVDSVKDTIVVGDNIAFEMSVSVDNEREAEVSEDTLLYMLYYSVEGATKIGTEQITYESKKIECDVYEYTLFGESKYWVDPDTMVVYKSISNIGMEITSVLGDTNLDLSLTEYEQEVKVGTYLNHITSYKASINGTYVELTGTNSYKVTADLGDGNFDVTNTIKMSGTASVDEKVIAINGDELTIDTSEEKMTKEQFKAFVSFDDCKTYLNTLGTVVEGEKKPMGTMDVATGKRNVTEQDLEVTTDDDEKITFTFQYGDKGVIYSIKYNNDAQGVVIIIKNSSLIVKG